MLINTAFLTSHSYILSRYTSLEFVCSAEVHNSGSREALLCSSPTAKRTSRTTSFSLCRRSSRTASSPQTVPSRWELLLQNSVRSTRTDLNHRPSLSTPPSWLQMFKAASTSRVPLMAASWTPSTSSVSLPKGWSARLVWRSRLLFREACHTARAVLSACSPVWFPGPYHSGDGFLPFCAFPINAWDFTTEGRAVRLLTLAWSSTPMARSSCTLS